MRNLRTQQEEQETKTDREKRLRSKRKRMSNLREQQEELETKAQTNERWCSDRLRKKTARNEATKMVLNNDDENYHIQNAMKEGLEELHCTKHDNNPLKHRVHVCIVCDAVIIGTESINRLKQQHLKAHRERLGVKEYRKYHGKDALHPELEKQYSVKGLEGMILSPRARHDVSGFPCCTCCFSAMRPSMALKDPPKFLLANGFATGSIPKRISYMKKRRESDC